MGFRVQITMDFRLARINAPEVRGETRAAGDAATAFLTNLIAGRRLLVKSDKGTDKYGRWIGDIYVDDAGTWVSVSDQMVSAGHAVPFMV